MKKEFYQVWIIPIVLNLIYVKLMSKYPKGTSIISILFVDISIVYYIYIFNQILPIILNPDDIFMYYGTFVFFCVIFLVFNFTVGFYWGQINIAIAIIDCAADFLNATRRILFLSFFYFLVICSFTISLVCSGFVLTM